MSNNKRTVENDLEVLKKIHDVCEEHNVELMDLFGIIAGAMEGDLFIVHGKDDNSEKKGLVGIVLGAPAFVEGVKKNLVEQGASLKEEEGE